MTSRSRRSIGALLAVLTLASVGGGFLTSTPAAEAVEFPAGQVYVAEGRFMVDGEPIALKGVNVEVNSYFTRNDFKAMSQMGMNSIRMRVHWATLEPDPPTRTADGWNRDYDSAAMDRILRYTRWAYEFGMYTVIDNHNCGFCDGSLTGDPTWAHLAAYNSLGKTYNVSTKAGLLEYYADRWIDTDRKTHTRAVLRHLAWNLKDEPGIVGYQMMNEPQPGDLTPGADSTMMVSRVQRSWAESVRAIDPNRVIFFQTRYGYLPGLANAELDKWAALGNVAADLHDGFGARWGVGLEMEEKQDRFLEGLQKVNNNINNPETPPWTGTLVAKMNHYLNRIETLQPYGIPLYVGEFGYEQVRMGAMQYWGATLGAMCEIGDDLVSWSARDWSGARGLFDDDGNKQPWHDMIVEAAQTDC